MRTTGTDPVVRQWITDFVAETLRAEALEQVVARLDNALIARVPELAERDIRRDLAASTRAHALAVLGALTQDRSDYPVPQQAHDFARTIARRGHDLRLLLRVYHLGQEAVLDYLIEILDQRELPRDIERAVLTQLFERSIGWVSTSVEQLTDTYTEERERGLRAALNQRAELVRDLLAGSEVDIDQASARLGYRLAGRHLAGVLWTDESMPGAMPLPDNGFGAAGGDSEVLGLLDRVVARMAAALGSRSVLTVPSGASALWVWLAVESDAARLPNAVEAPVRIAVGAPAAGIAGFRDSHREAVSARQVAERAVGQIGRVLHYPDVEVAYLAGADEAAMRALIVRELGPLAVTGVGAARLRETLHAYLRCHRSPDAAAKRLGVHKNTVRYRIQRIEELLGHPIEQRSLRLEIALDCAAVYGVR
ncbi:helix-turn-helix domain-containing protein [Nocardia sp. CDC159]|uniref:Helix-turn-helix domain-containing protein n=1 Tax=Nocardia pulmonis TaxID=2951408 RepID=A0A9X2IVR9_9NOCA|nr:MULTISPECIES: helix-turn-helix domain-containing protein [Nocardia]MCM6772794.1 helix-turn-helix domain-containing protein [Nocardia pulmonis]MCM6785903.1 helix-turn-helix domain-containing protein [Nocardia sp. CDC159]